MKLGLQRSQRLAEALDHPEASLRFVHVAGTNGKGSVCVFAEALAREAGLRTGLYTSPHLRDFRERIQVDRKIIPQPDLAMHLARVREVLVGWEELPTFFEVTTMVALLHFAKRKVDLVLWETGLGGRLDATNVVTPAVSVVTPIAYDHMRILGETLAEIAGEKAGIFKPNIPAYSAAQQPEAAEVLVARARAVGAPLTFLSPTPTEEKLNVGLGGPHQRENARLAVAAIRSLGVHLDDHRVAKALASATWPARFQLTNGWLIDGAHNPHGAAALAVAWTWQFGSVKTQVVLGAMADKNHSGMLEALRPITKELHIAPVNSSRSMLPSDLADQARKHFSEPNIHVHPTLESAMNAAFSSGSLPTVICGSLFLCAEALERLGVATGVEELQG